MAPFYNFAGTFEGYKLPDDDFHDGIADSTKVNKLADYAKKVEAALEEFGIVDKCSNHLHFLMQLPWD